MKAERIILKALFIIAFASGTIMAWHLFGIEFAHSYSENAVTENDPWLRAYLWPASIAFALMAGWAKNREDTFKFIRHNWKIKWKWLYLADAIAFMLVGITNVSQIYIPHLIATGLVALVSDTMCWNYFTTRWKKEVARAIIIFGTAFFLTSFIFNISTVAKGEWIISIAVIWVAWVIINEQVRPWKQLS